ncbi:MAG: beta-propeller domain-containing protein, partial [Clostridia bacterium]|nr:beta-propeller domain-containing protein [Clostridia bacterium]
IVSPEVLTSTQYAVLCKLDENTLEMKGSAAFLSYSEEIYVSREQVYASRSYTDTLIEGDMRTSKRMTEIAGIRYSGDTLTYAGSVSIEGTVKDQYSMDEHQGMLRVVTTTRTQKWEEHSDGDTTSATFLESAFNASLYCIDLTRWEVAAEVKDFAPDGESVQSVRFDGDAAYVCTAVVVTLSDPVFFFDLSDLNNITYKDTGTIEGFSTSLISFGDGYLIGIGVNDNGSGVKIEIYEETESGVNSVCSYVVENATYSTNYKSYLIDRENLLIGLDIMHFNTGLEYHLLQYENGQLTLLEAIESTGTIGQTRAFYEEGYLYICSDTLFMYRPIDLIKSE